MPRAHRVALGGLVYHVLNRANARLQLFAQDGDYQAFERVLAEACERVGRRLLAYCVMPNHWHLVVWPHANEAAGIRIDSPAPGQAKETRLRQPQ